MSRLIDGDALIEKAHHEAQGMSKPFKDQFGVLVEWLVEKTPIIEPEPQWIPCSERLPDVARRVLLSGHGQVMVGILHSFGKYSLEPTGISYVYPKDDIEAWMPLPEPYKK